MSAWTIPEINRVLAAISSGVPPKTVAANHGRSIKAVQQACRHYGVSYRTAMMAGRAAVRRDALLMLRTSTVDEVAEAFGVKANTITLWRRLDPSPRQRRTLMTPLRKSILLVLEGHRRHGLTMNQLGHALQRSYQSLQRDMRWLENRRWMSCGLVSGVRHYRLSDLGNRALRRSAEVKPIPLFKTC